MDKSPKLYGFDETGSELDDSDPPNENNSVTVKTTEITKVMGGQTAEESDPRKVKIISSESTKELELLSRKKGERPVVDWKNWLKA
jgi:hypothetical protein